MQNFGTWKAAKKLIKQQEVKLREEVSMRCWFKDVGYIKKKEI